MPDHFTRPAQSDRPRLPDGLRVTLKLLGIFTLMFIVLAAVPFAVAVISTPRP